MPPIHFVLYTNNTYSRVRYTLIWLSLEVVSLRVQKAHHLTAYKDV